MTAAAAVAKMDIVAVIARRAAPRLAIRAGLDFAFMLSTRRQCTRERNIRSQAVPRGGAAQLCRSDGGRDVPLAEPHGHRRAFLRVPGALGRQPPDPL